MVADVDRNDFFIRDQQFHRDAESKKNIQEGQGHLSRGVVTGFRNPIMHGPIDANVPAVFSEVDCLNVLSLVSYLITRLDGATINP